MKPPFTSTEDYTGAIFTNATESVKLLKALIKGKRKTMNQQGNGQPRIIPQDALNTIASALRQIKLTLDEHSLLLRCVEVIQEAINPSPKVEKVEKSVKSRAVVSSKEDVPITAD